MLSLKLAPCAAVVAQGRDVFSGAPVQRANRCRRAATRLSVVVARVSVPLPSAAANKDVRQRADKLFLMYRVPTTTVQIK